MKATKKDKDDFIKSYDEFTKGIVDSVVEYKYAMLEIINKHNFKSIKEFDFDCFAREVFLHNVKKYYDKTNTEETLLREVKNLLK